MFFDADYKDLSTEDPAAGTYKFGGGDRKGNFRRREQSLDHPESESPHEVDQTLLLPAIVIISNKSLLPLIESLSSHTEHHVKKLLFEKIVDMVWNLLPRCYVIDKGLEEVLLLFLKQDIAKLHFLKSIEQLSINALNNREFQSIFKKYSEKLIPILAKNINDKNKKLSLNAILALSMHCS